MAIVHGVQPLRYAFGAAAALATLDASIVHTPELSTEILLSIWYPDTPFSVLNPTARETAVLDVVSQGMDRFISWQKTNYAVDSLNNCFS